MVSFVPGRGSQASARKIAHVDLRKPIVKPVSSRGGRGQTCCSLEELPTAAAAPFECSSSHFGPTAPKSRQDWAANLLRNLVPGDAEIQM